MAALVDILIRATRAGRVLEIGAGNGTTVLELGAALPAEGRLIILERDPAAAAQARAALATAGLDRRVTVMIGDAARSLHKIAGPFEAILMDSDPGQYAALHERLVQRLAPGGLLVMRGMIAAGDYNTLLAADARLTTTFLNIDEGLALSVKRLDLT